MDARVKGCWGQSGGMDARVKVAVAKPYPYAATPHRVVVSEHRAVPTRFVVPERDEVGLGLYRADR